MGATYKKPAITFSTRTTLDSEGNAMLKAHAYLAQTDGFVSVLMSIATAGNQLQGYIGDTNDPAGAGDLMQRNLTSDDGEAVCQTLHVARGEYFEIVDTEGTNDPTIWWRSRGPLRAPVDHN